ncbi:transposase (plasmid) [Candidatus Fukatsuia symbiotica]|uniref:transposase n=1 Tax=Candidatus Fukatsuia symbiotica TaxID=1878942 RepID=UPI000E6CFB07|nr:transposase [Candidatus Fukatsuia symbiotica]MEA9445921.1 transposase [Candidatus Fukatsuia symbiotica]
MDNVSLHKRQDIQQAIRSAGHLIEYLFPYSPDLNLIEYKWAQAKSKRRAINCDIDRLFYELIN